MRTLGNPALGVGLVVICIGVGMIVMSPTHSSRKEAASAEKEPLPQMQRRAPLTAHFAAPMQAESGAVVSTVQSPDEPYTEDSESDQAAEAVATLESQYAADGRPTPESAEKEAALKNLFSEPDLKGKGHLEDVECRDTVCRGVVRIENEQLDSEVFGQTFLSVKFAEAIHDAVTIASRERMADGTVVATFFIHPQVIVAR